MGNTKELICETAIALFKDKGYDHVSVNDICQACSITKTTFYYHLKTKEELIYNFYGPVTQSIAVDLMEILEAGSCVNQIIVCFETLLTASEDLGVDLTAQLFIMNLKEDRGTYNLKEEITRICLHLIEKAQQNGEINNTASPQVLYETICHAAIGQELMWCIKKGDFNRREKLAGAIRGILN